MMSDGALMKPYYCVGGPLNFAAAAVVVAVAVGAVIVVGATHAAFAVGVATSVVAAYIVATSVGKCC